MRSGDLAALVADALLSLYQLGWEPMTPIDMGITSSVNWREACTPALHALLDALAALG